MNRKAKNKAQKKYKASVKGLITQRKYYRSNAKKRANKRWAQKEENKIKQNAHYLVRKALQEGLLVKQLCISCDSGNSFAHHEDYSKPLEVIWLCNEHHTELHRKQL